MSDQGDSGQREVAQRIAASVDDVERAKLLAWVFQLVQIRDSSGSLFAKGRDALSVTFREGVAWPVVKLVGSEMRRLAWDERGLKWRTGFIIAIAGGVLTGGQGAGIAALGGAIGVPLWLVLGAGGSFLAMLYEELFTKETGAATKPGVSVFLCVRRPGNLMGWTPPFSARAAVAECERALLPTTRAGGTS